MIVNEYCFCFPCPVKQGESHFVFVVPPFVGIREISGCHILPAVRNGCLSTPPDHFRGRNHRRIQPVTAIGNEGPDQIRSLGQPPPGLDRFPEVKCIEMKGNGIIVCCLKHLPPVTELIYIIIEVKAVRLISFPIALLTQ